METIEFRYTIGLFLYGLVSFVIPTAYIHKRLYDHYRESISLTGSHWHRKYCKWIVWNRIYYTDELRNDLVFSVFGGAVFGLLGAACLVRLARFEETAQLLVSSALSSGLCIVLMSQFLRAFLIDKEINFRSRVDQNFNVVEHLQRVFHEDPGLLKRVIFSARYD